MNTKISRTLTAVVLLTCLGLLGRFETFAYADEISPLNLLRVMTYNIWGLPRPFLKDRGRFAHIKKMLPTLNADVIGFQESFTDHAKPVYNIPEFPYRARGELRKRPHALIQGDGLGVISRFPISRVQRLRFDDCKGTDCLSRKGALLVTIEHPSSSVDVVVTHLNAAGSNGIRVKQTRELITFIGKHCGERPLVVMGDLNAIPTDQPLTELKNQLWVQDAHQDFISANPDLPKADKDAFTYDYSQNTVLKSKNHNGHSKRIDYVLFRSGASKELKAVRTDVVMDTPVQGRNLSDHFGFTADLIFE